jgi:hypothetical protein
MDEASFPPQRELRAGRDFPLWPHLKFNHARRHANKLHDDFSLWRSSLGEETRTEYSADRRVATFYASIRNAPPTDEWSLTFGDAIHNFRSALDSLAWSLAHLDGNRPERRDEQRIYFPLCQTLSAFEKEATTTLRSMPDFALQRLESVQPYHGGPPESAISRILHELDIRDKHRSSIELASVAADKTTYGIVHRYRDRDYAPDSESEPYEWLGDEGPVRDGQPIARQRFAKPVEMAEILSLPLVLLISHNGTKYDAFHLLTLIERQLSATFHRIELGFLPDDAELLNPGGTDADEFPPVG